MNRVWIVMTLLVALFEWNGYFIKIFPVFYPSLNSVKNSEQSLDPLEVTSCEEPDLIIPSSNSSNKSPYRVLLISGHGTLASDPGATYEGRYEYAYAQELVDRITDTLSSNEDIDLILEPTPMVVSEEIAFINQVEADLILSIHFNAGKGSGSEIIVPLYIDDLFFSKTIIQNLEAINQPIRITPIYSRTATSKIARVDPIAIAGTDYYGVIRAGASRQIPSYIIEVEFIDNVSNMTAYDTHVQDYADSISNAIKDAAMET